MAVIEHTLAQMGIALPEAPRPLGNFVPYMLDGDMLYISGQISVDESGQVVTGKLGADLSLDQGIVAARFCAIGLLARAKGALGDLDRIARVIKLGAFVNAAPDFGQHPQVVNGASDLMVQVFGPKIGNHVRFAVGSSSLPAQAAVEIEAVFRVTPER